MATVTHRRCAQAPRVRAGAGPGRGRLPEADGLERRPGRGLRRCAAPHAEGARDRAAARLAPRRRRLPAAHRARARRARSARSSRACASPRSARSSRRSTSRRSCSAAQTGSRTATTACPRSRCSTPTWTATPSSSGCGSRRRRRGTAASSTTASCPPRRASTSARSRSRRAAIPGQEPIARQHYRGKVNRRLRVLEVEGDAGARDARRARREGGRPRHERGRRARARLRARRGAGRRRARRGRRAGAATLAARAPVAQGIERCPAEAEVASSNLAGRTRVGLPSAVDQLQRKRCTVPMGRGRKFVSFRGLAALGVPRRVAVRRSVHVVAQRLRA